MSFHVVRGQVFPHARFRIARNVLQCLVQYLLEARRKLGKFDCLQDATGPQIIDLLEALDQIREEGHTSVVICPVGFVADHLEVLYDIDIEAAAHADALGVRLVRAPTAGCGADFLGALGNLLQPHVREAARA